MSKKMDVGLIKRQALAWISGLLLLVLLWLCFDQLLFLSRAESAQGRVTKVYSRNETCSTSSGRGRSRRYNCTKFRASVEYITAQGMPQSLDLSANSVHGLNQPITRSRLQNGQSLEILYDPKLPSHAKENEFWTLWGIQLVLFTGVVITFGLSFVESAKASKSRPETYAGRC